MKILLITHNPVSSYNNMGKTFLSLFSCFDKKELCQLYVHPTIPDVDVCSSYFRITDKDVLKSIFKFSAPGGEISQTEISEKNKTATQSAPGVPQDRNSKPIYRILRDCMWKCSRWYSKKLKSWIEEQAPDCIFLAPGYAKFIYDIALKISKARNIPIITYICDDYYFVNSQKGVIGEIQLFFLKKKTENLMKSTSRVIAISEEIRNIYQSKFNVKSHLIMTGAQNKRNGYQNIIANNISYFGNLGANRYLSLRDIGRALDEINTRRGTNIALNIYTGNAGEDVLNAFKNISCINVMSFLKGDDYNKAVNSSRVLVHVEGFDEKSIDLVKHSISTKIADGMAGGIPFFAYAPENISSMKHLIRNDSAIVATSAESLIEKLEDAIFDEESRLRVVSNALVTADTFHNMERNSRLLYDMFLECIDSGENNNE